MRQVQDLLFGAVGRDEVVRAGLAQRVLQQWPDVVGPVMAERSWPERFENGTVWVAVSGSAWAQELRFAEEAILAKLNEISGGRVYFRAIRCGVRPIPPREAEIIVPEPAVDPGESVVSGEPEDLSIREIAERRLRNWPRKE